jgi:hypothetical protein
MRGWLFEVFQGEHLAPGRRSKDNEELLKIKLPRGDSRVDLKLEKAGSGG